MRIGILAIFISLVFIVGVMIGEGLPGGTFITANPTYILNDQETGGYRTGIQIRRKQLIPAITMVKDQFVGWDKLGFTMTLPMITTERSIGLGIDNWEAFCPLEHTSTTSLIRSSTN